MLYALKPSTFKALMPWPWEEHTDLKTLTHLVFLALFSLSEWYNRHLFWKAQIPRLCLSGSSRLTVSFMMLLTQKWEIEVNDDGAVSVGEKLKCDLETFTHSPSTNMQEFCINESCFQEIYKIITLILNFFFRGQGISLIFKTFDQRLLNS